MRKVRIAHDPRFHYGFVDIATAANGDLVMIYKRADAHTSHEFTDLVVQTSPDQGRTWSEPVTVIETHDSDNVGLIRDPRVLRLNDGSLMGVASMIGPRRTRPRQVPYFERYMQQARAFVFRSFDHGRTWQTEETQPIPMICALRQLRSGVMLLGATQFHYRYNPPQVNQAQVVYRSLDNGCTWEGPIAAGDHPEHALGEGDFVELDDGTVICYMRDEIFRPDLPVRTGGSKSFSYDQGQTWDGPYHVGRWLFNGRIAAGRLASGDVMVLTRLGMGTADPYSGYFWEEPRRLPEFVGYYQHGSSFLHAYIESQADARLKHPRFVPYSAPLPDSGRWLLVDRDLNEHADFGYPGWVTLPSGEAFAVDFLADDVPAAQCQIRAYVISPEELARPDRRERLRLGTYQAGPLVGQDRWVHRSGPRTATATVWPEAGVGPLALSADVQAELVAGGQVIPTLDASRSEAEVARRDIGPFNLFDETVQIEFEHRGQAQWCGLQVLDDCWQPIVELQAQAGQPNLLAHLPRLRQSVDSAVPANGTWLRTRISITTAGVALATRQAAAGEFGAPWCQADLPDLQVVSAVGLKLGGGGDFVLRAVDVRPVKAR